MLGKCHIKNKGAHGKKNLRKQCEERVRFGETVRFAILRHGER